MTNDSNMSENEAQRLLGLEENDLYLELGEAVDDGISGFGKSPAELVASGKLWLSLNLLALRERICGDETVLALRRSNDRIKLIITLANIFIVPFDGFPTMVVAALLLQIGLDSVCADGS